MYIQNKLDRDGLGCRLVELDIVLDSKISFRLGEPPFLNPEMNFSSENILTSIKQTYYCQKSLQPDNYYQSKLMQIKVR